MPLITTCPACEAKFVVSTAQLEAHHGDVRCGKCKNVFNALAHLESIADTDDASRAIDNAAPSSDGTNIDYNSADQTAESESATAQATLFTDEAPSDDAVDEQNTEWESEAPINKTTVIPAFDAAKFQLETAADTQSSKKTKSKTKTQENKHAEESLVLDKHSKSLAWLSWLLVLILLILAGLQATYYFRTEISAHYPQLKPYLVQACDALGCKIELPKQADLLVIDDSDLQEDAEREGLIRLNTTLLNRAEYALAYPLLEITLTDATDKVLMRKRFKPSEYLPPETPVAEGVPANDSVYVHLALTANKQVVAGYRLFITY